MTKEKKITFAQLSIGDTFDCIDDAHPTWNSFYDRCEKISTRKYRSVSTGVEYQVGSVNVTIHHVQRKETTIK